MNATDKIKAQGIDAKRDSAPKVSVYDIFIPIDGPLAHPRANDLIDEELLKDIMDQGEVIEPVDVRRDGIVDGKLRLTLIDGSRRTLTLREAVRRWQAAGTYREDQKYIRIRYFTGDDKAALLHRLRKNTDPLKKPDAPSVLAKTAMQLDKAKATPEEILAVMPRSVSSKSELAALLRWPDLTPEAVSLFDAGTVALGVLGAVLDVPREKQAAIAAELAEANMTTMKGATRFLNRKRFIVVENNRKPCLDTADDPAVENRPGDRRPEADPAPTVDGRSRTKNGSLRNPSFGERMHPKTIEKIAHAVERSEDNVESMIEAVLEGQDGADDEWGEQLRDVAAAARVEGFVLACRMVLGKVSLDTLPEGLRKAVVSGCDPKGK